MIPSNPFRSLLVIVVVCLQSDFSFAQDPIGAKEEKATASQGGETKIKSFDDLAQAYERQKIKITKNEKAQTLLFPTTVGKLQGAMVVSWDSKNGVLHLIQTMPVSVPKEKTDQYLRAAQTLNHGFLFPGIGLDLKKGTAYYRMTIPISPRGYIYDYELGTYTKFVMRKAAEFSPTMEAVVTGEISVEDVNLYHRKRLFDLLDKKPVQIRLMPKYERTISDNKWVLDFSVGNVLKVYRDGKLVVESKLEISGDLCELEDTAGDLSSDGIGSYKLIVSNGKLSFRPEKDPSNNRKAVLSGGVWSAAK